MRNYSRIDLLRFRRFANENNHLEPIELLKAYDIKYPELSEKEKLINMAKGLRIENLYKALTGESLPPEEDNTPTTLCRSTYRTDSNDKMMYEGDEVVWNNRVWIIEWCNESCAFMLSDGEERQYIRWYEDYTLTGKNKHDG